MSSPQRNGPVRAAGTGSLTTAAAWSIIAAAVLGTIVVGLILSGPVRPTSTGCGLDCGLIFSWGAPINATGSTPIGCPSIDGHYCYTIEVAGSAVELANLSFFLRAESGSRVPWPYPAIDTVILIDPQGAIVADYNTVGSTWSGPANSTWISGGDTLVIYTPQTGAGYGLFSDSIVAVIQDSPEESGSIPSEGFP